MCIYIYIQYNILYIYYEYIYIYPWNRHVIPLVVPKLAPFERVMARSFVKMPGVEPTKESLEAGRAYEQMSLGTIIFNGIDLIWVNDVNIKSDFMLNGDLMTTIDGYWLYIYIWFHIDDNGILVG